MNNTQKKKGAQDQMKKSTEKLSQIIVMTILTNLINDQFQYTTLTLDLFFGRKPKTKKEIRRARRRWVILDLKLKLLTQFHKACMHLTKRGRNI